MFAKWRAVFKVGRHTPSRASIRRNAADLADYAARVQRCGLLPILEPEVLAEGDHDLQRAAAASARVRAPSGEGRGGGATEPLTGDDLCGQGC